FFYFFTASVTHKKQLEKLPFFFGKADICHTACLIGGIFSLSHIFTQIILIQQVRSCQNLLPDFLHIFEQSENRFDRAAKLRSQRSCGQSRYSILPCYIQSGISYFISCKLKFRGHLFISLRQHLLRNICFLLYGNSCFLSSSYNSETEYVTLLGVKTPCLSV